jgi:acyl dehydratase
VSIEQQESVITDEHRALIGVETEPGYHLIEAGAVRRFCDAVGLKDPIYTDAAAARAAGHPERPIPPTYWCSIMSPGSELRRPNFDHFGSRNMNGGTEYEYVKPAYVGQTLACTMRVADIYEKQGRSGRMVFTILENIWRDDKGDVVTKSRLTGIRL